MSIDGVLTRDEWVKAAKCYLGTCKFQLLDYTVKMLGGDGGGFLGEHRLVDVTVRLEGSNDPPRVLHFFYKTEPQAMPEQKDIITQTGCFRKEVEAVDTLFARLRAALVDNGTGMEWSCKCYYTRPDVIVLENLAIQGFRIIQNRDPIGFQHCAVVLKALANLHSASLIFEETHSKKPCRLDSEFKDVLAEGFFRYSPNHPGLAWLKAGIKGVWTLVDHLRGEDYLRRTKTKLEEAILIFYELEKPSKRFRNVVNQGDMWRNNIFFRFEDDKPVEARLIDFQLVRYAPPANDISCFLYLSTRREFRKEYSQKLYALYYDHLSDNLKRNGLDPEKVLPWEEFKASCEFYKMLGVVASAAYSSVIFPNAADMSHVFASSEEFNRFLLHERSPEILQAFKNDDFYRGKATEIIEEFIEECIDKKFDKNFYLSYF
ncbi:hypothetical protein R5R35_009047 [Gryllus longicercus]|uniref:CHK kinase-like domain-containing protein n=1 Tax=Gryllus longicercus TaxID=2509291 RepID=A0AAN9WIU3_9ORTH